MSSKGIDGAKPTTKKVLVCGGRNYANKTKLFHILDIINKLDLISCIIEGGCKGADHLARLWAQHNMIKTITISADWNTYGKAAGPIRN